MKIFIVFIYVMFSLMGYSQGFNEHHIGSDGVQGNLEFHDVDGNLIPIGYHPDINGTPMLNEKSGYASIIFKNRQPISDSMINYSLFDNKLFFIRNGQYYLINFPVKDFTIQYSENQGAKISYHFKSGFPTFEEFDSSTFFEVLLEGNSFEFLKWQHKRILESQNYGGAIEKEYSTLQEFLVYLPKENKMVSLGIKPTINGIKKSFPSYLNQIDSYITAHKTNFKKEGEYIQLFSYLESESKYKL